MVQSWLLYQRRLWTNGGIVAERIVPARAFENGVWIAYANHAGSENGFTYLGGSRIVAPNGHEAAIGQRL